MTEYAERNRRLFDGLKTGTVTSIDAAEVANATAFATLNPELVFTGLADTLLAAFLRWGGVNEAKDLSASSQRLAEEIVALKELEPLPRQHDARYAAGWPSMRDRATA